MGKPIRCSGFCGRLEPVVRADSPSVGISWLGRDDFISADQDYTIPSLDKLYPLLDFDKATGWSRFLRDNVMRKSFTE